MATTDRQGMEDDRLLHRLRHGSAWIAETTVSPRRNRFGEYVVRCFDAAGRHLRDCDYFTNSLDDAVATAACMERDAARMREAMKTL